MDLKNAVRKYFRKKSRFSIASDIVFVALVIALLFPSSRMMVVSTIQRLTLFQPSIEKSDSSPKLPEKAYEWTFQDMNGETVSLSRFDNKVIFLNFWATWCPPCVAEMPTIQDLYGHFGDRMAFVLVSNEKQQVIEEFIKKNEYSFPVYKGIYQVPKELSTQTLPTTFIIAKDGRVVLRKEGSAKWDGSKVKEKIEQLISQ